MSDRGGGLPGRPSDLEGLPTNLVPLVFEGFDGLNTKPLRPALTEKEAYICDGFFPLGPSNLRTLYGVGPAIYHAPAGRTILWHQGCNLGDSTGIVVLLDNGALEFISYPSGAATDIAPAGTITTPSSVLGFSQWASPKPMLIFANDQENGYWLWDGATLFTAGSLSPEITITASGKNYTSAPVIDLQTTGAGTGVVFSTQLENGMVTQIICTNGGSGFAVDDFVALSFSGGGSDTQGVAQAVLSDSTHGGIDQIVVTKGGSGYTGATNIEVSVGGFADAPSFSPTIVDGVITAVAVINAGTGFSSPPTIIANDPGFSGNHIPGGTGAEFEAILACGQVTQISGIDPGSGYIEPPSVTVIGDGTGATAVAQITNNQISGYVMKTYGKGYTKALVILSGGNNAAGATCRLMPYGYSGTSVEVYNNQVWIVNGGATATFPPKNRLQWTAPGTATDVDPGDGAGALLSNNAQLRVGYHTIKQVNGFLYLIGDSALDQISGVKESTTAATSSTSASTSTVFSVVGLDPQIGTPWPSSVQALNRNLVFGNALGVMVGYGSALTKVSEQLDGFYANGPIFGATANFSSAVAEIFGRYVYMLLLPIHDQVTGNLVNKLLMWDSKRWFTASQDRSLTYISTLELNSLMTAFGTDGHDLFPLFQTPTTSLTKTVQSRLWSIPEYANVKVPSTIQGVLNLYSGDGRTSVTIDNEVGKSGATTISASGSAFVWTNNSGGIINFGALQFTSSGLAVFGPTPVGQIGRLIGMTFTTTSSDLALLSLRLHTRIESELP